MPNPEIDAMKRVLQQIMSLCKEVDGKSMQGLKEPQDDESSSLDQMQDQQSPEPQEGELGGEEQPGDKQKLLALARQRNGG